MLEIKYAHNNVLKEVELNKFSYSKNEILHETLLVNKY